MEQYRKSDGFVSVAQKVHYVMILLWSHYYFAHYIWDCSSHKENITYSIII